MLILVTAREMTINQVLAFIVNAPSRAKAKSIVRHHSDEKGYDLSVYMHTYELKGELIRIDHLIQ